MTGQERPSILPAAGARDFVLTRSASEEMTYSLAGASGWYLFAAASSRRRPLRKAVTLLRKKCRYAQGGHTSRNRTHPETGSRLAVLLGAFARLQRVSEKASLRATQVFVRQGEAPSVVSHRRASAACKILHKSAMSEV